MYQFKSKNDLFQFIAQEVLTSGEAADYLNITRATLSSLVKRLKLTPIKETHGTRLFFKEDLEYRRLEMEHLRAKYRPYDH